MTQDPKDPTATMIPAAARQIFCAILTTAATVAATVTITATAAAEPATRPAAAVTRRLEPSTATARGIALAGRGLQKSGLMTPGQRAVSSAVLFGASLLQAPHQSRRRATPDDGRAVGVRGTLAIDWIYLEF